MLLAWINKLSLNISILITLLDSKLFWVSCKRYFSNNCSEADTNTVLNEDGDMILKNEDIAQIFNDYFSSLVNNLDLHHWEDKIFFQRCGGERLTKILKECVNLSSMY